MYLIIVAVTAGGICIALLIAAICYKRKRRSKRKTLDVSEVQLGAMLTIGRSGLHRKDSDVVEVYVYPPHHADPSLGIRPDSSRTRISTQGSQTITDNEAYGVAADVFPESETIAYNQPLTAVIDTAGSPNVMVRTYDAPSYWISALHPSMEANDAYVAANVALDDEHSVAVRMDQGTAVYLDTAPGDLAIEHPVPRHLGSNDSSEDQRNGTVPCHQHLPLSLDDNPVYGVTCGDDTAAMEPNEAYGTTLVAQNNSPNLENVGGPSTSDTDRSGDDLATIALTPEQSDAVYLDESPANLATSSDQQLHSNEAYGVYPQLDVHSSTKDSRAFKPPSADPSAIRMDESPAYTYTVTSHDLQSNEAYGAVAGSTEIDRQGSDRGSHSTTLYELERYEEVFNQEPITIVLMEPSTAYVSGSTQSGVK